MVVRLVVHLGVPAVRPGGRPMRVRGNRGGLVPPAAAPPARGALERVEARARAAKVPGRGVECARRVRRGGAVVRARVRARMRARACAWTAAARQELYS